MTVTQFLRSGVPQRAALGFCLLVFLMVPGWAQASDQDPLEPINRVVFEFNDVADRYVMRPVAQGYDAVAPPPVQTGVGNFFANLIDANGAINAFLQGRLNQGFSNTGRFLVNSTLGLLGLFDVASQMGIPRYQTDFGHTLATWGAPQGAYVVLPLLGPRTVRSGVGSVFDGYVTPLTLVEHEESQWALRGLELVDLRADLLGADELVTGDRYLFVREAYLQRRSALTSDEPAGDEFSNFDDTWEEDGL